MGNELAEGWHISRAGTTYGPYQWNDLAAWAQQGQIHPHDLVWHSQLPGWTVAQQVPGLFSTPAVSYAQASRASSHRLRWALLSGLAVLVVAGAVIGALFAAGVFGNDIPVVKTPMQSPTVIDVPYEAAEMTATPEEGGRLEVQGIEVSVPTGAVASSTTLEVKIMQEAFHMSEEAPPAGDSSAPVCVGPVVDFGPEGTAFDEPVTITLPYDETRLPVGVSEDTVAMAYWDGTVWVGVSGLVDKDKNTVSVQLTEFDGLIETTIAGVIIVGTAIIGTGAYLWDKWTDPNIVHSDPVSDGKARDYVTPKDPTVQAYAAQAVLWDEGENQSKSLTDPDLATWLDDKAKLGRVPILAYKDAGGTMKKAENTEGKGANWQLPNHYFQTGADKGPLSGDCTDTTAGAVSVFRAAGLHAVGVYGYVKAGQDKGASHVWGEVLIGDKKYFVDEYGGLRSFSRNPDDTYIQRYEAATDSPHRKCMWDENDQYPYDPDWYKKYLRFTTTTNPYAYEWVGTETWGGNKFRDIQIEFTLPADGDFGSVLYLGTNKDGEEVSSTYQAWQDTKDNTVYVEYSGIMLSGKFVDANTIVLRHAEDAQMGEIVWELTRRQ